MACKGSGVRIPLPPPLFSIHKPNAVSLFLSLFLTQPWDRQINIHLEEN
jgi:hypothetical protein